MGMGMGTRGLRGYPNPCGFGPRVARASTRQGGDNPPCRVSCWSTQQGGLNPPCRVDSRFSTQQGGRDPPRHVDLCRLVCVCVCDGVSNGGGEQLGRGGRGLELDYYVVFNLKTYLLWGWA